MKGHQFFCKNLLLYTINNHYVVLEIITSYFFIVWKWCLEILFLTYILASDGYILSALKQILVEARFIPSVVRNLLDVAGNILSAVSYILAQDGNMLAAKGDMLASKRYIHVAGIF